MSENAWVSPDGKIRKCIIGEGVWGLKPTENSLCNILIEDCSSNSFEGYSNVREVTIGDSANKFERLLHDCLLTMHNGEKSKCVFKLSGSDEVTFSLTLLGIVSDGFIYQWDARKKCDIALKHKVEGNNQYIQSRYIDASHRFGKALKILCSIPIQVDEPPDSVDTVDVKEIHTLKTVLYNNLASCYLKEGKYEIVIILCNKVLLNDKDNVKALYKQGVAKCETRDYGGAFDNLKRVLAIEPDNKAALAKLKFLDSKIAQSNADHKAIIRKMFSK